MLSRNGDESFFCVLCLKDPFEAIGTWTGITESCCMCYSCSVQYSTYHHATGIGRANGWVIGKFYRRLESDLGQIHPLSTRSVDFVDKCMPLMPTDTMEQHIRRRSSHQLIHVGTYCRQYSGPGKNQPGQGLRGVSVHGFGNMCPSLRLRRARRARRHGQVSTPAAH